MNREDISNCILSNFRDKEVLADITLEQNFFDLGVSSLTVVELQITIEKALKMTVSTKDLMRLPTVKDWIDLYAEKNEEVSLVES